MLLIGCLKGGGFLSRSGILDSLVVLPNDQVALALPRHATRTQIAVPTMPPLKREDDPLSARPDRPAAGHPAQRAWFRIPVQPAVDRAHGSAAPAYRCVAGRAVSASRAPAPDRASAQTPVNAQPDCVCSLAVGEVFEALEDRDEDKQDW
jgi:hypothetical protein